MAIAKRSVNKMPIGWALLECERCHRTFRSWDRSPPYACQHCRRHQYNHAALKLFIPTTSDNISTNTEEIIMENKAVIGKENTMTNETTVNTNILERDNTAMIEWNTAQQASVDYRIYTDDTALVVDKKSLVGRELLIVEVRINQSDTVQRVDENGIVTPGTYLSATCVLREALNIEGELVRKCLFHDGGKGLMPAIRLHIEKTDPEALASYESFVSVELRSPLYCKHGLRPSDYTVKLADGSSTKARTYYLA